MEIFFGITLIVLSLFLCMLIYMFQKQSDEITPSAVLGALIIVFLIAGINMINEYYSPSIAPIDVYRGKTTLEITYRDSVAIDSTVVWKEKIK